MSHDTQSMMEELEYWKRRATSASDECDELVAIHRNETDTLRRQCAELLHERSLMKAATASDVRTFILNYQADALRRSGGTHTSATDAVPVTKLLQFLHAYSNGLVPAPRNERKRDREPEVSSTSVLATTGGVTPQRLYQRLMLRRRQNYREHEMEEWVLQQQQQQQQQQAVHGHMDAPEGLDASLLLTAASSLEDVREESDGVEAMAAQLEREERERQLQDQRAHQAREDAPLVSVGGVDGHGQSYGKQARWRKADGGDGGNASH